MLLNELHSGGIRALYNYDTTVFDNFTIPEIFSKPSEFFPEYPDLSVITVNDIIDCILDTHGDNPLYRPNPVYMKYHIGEWSRRRRYVWARMYKDVISEYNPLHNYDRRESISHKNENELNTDNSVNATATDTTKSDGETTNKVSAENVSTFSNSEQTVSQSTDTANSKTDRQMKEKSKGNGTHVEENWIRGNIGVMSSYQLIGGDLDLIRRFDIVRYIADDFSNEFCLGVY